DRRIRRGSFRGGIPAVLARREFDGPAVRCRQGTPFGRPVSGGRAGGLQSNQLPCVLFRLGDRGADLSFGWRRADQPVSVVRPDRQAAWDGGRSGPSRQALVIPGRKASGGGT